MQRELLTVPDVARLLSLSPRSVYDLVEHPDLDRRLPVVRIGRRLRFRLDDVERWIDDHRAA